MIPEIEDRSPGINSHTEVTGCTVFSDALAWADCRVFHVYDGGDHSVLSAKCCGRLRAESKPLLYYRRNWRHMEDGALR